MWEWAKEQVGNAWDWVTSNDSIPGMVGNYVNNKINNDERAALLNSQALRGQENPSLSGYQTQNIRSTAGISGFDDIKEASNNRYASFLLSEEISSLCTIAVCSNGLNIGSIFEVSIKD